MPSPPPGSARSWEAPAGRMRRWPVVIASFVVAGLTVFALTSRDASEQAPPPDLQRGDELPLEPEPTSPRRPAPTPAPAAAHWAEHPDDVGQWTPLPEAPVGPRRSSVVAWTGVPGITVPREHGEVLVWGGNRDGVPLADGAAYDLRSGTWRPIADAPHPAAPTTVQSATWTGAELVVLVKAAGEVVGLAYDPAEDRWRETASPPSQLRDWQASGWTGTDVVVFGFDAGLDHHATVAYDPVADVWQLLDEPPVLDDLTRLVTATIADGLAVVGDQAGVPAITLLTQEGTWTPPDPLPAEAGPLFASLASDNTRDRVLLVGLGVGTRATYEAWAWDPQDGWIALPDLRAEERARRSVVTWSAGRAVTWLGEGDLPGAVLETTPSERWRPMSAPPLTPRSDAAVVGTGRSLFVWGGHDGTAALADGALFIPWEGVAEGRLRAGN